MNPTSDLFLALLAMDIETVPFRHQWARALVGDSPGNPNFSMCPEPFVLGSAHVRFGSNAA